MYEALDLADVVLDIILDGIDVGIFQHTSLWSPAFKLAALLRKIEFDTTNETVYLHRPLNLTGKPPSIRGHSVGFGWGNNRGIGYGIGIGSTGRGIGSGYGRARNYTLDEGVGMGRGIGFGFVTFLSDTRCGGNGTGRASQTNSDALFRSDKLHHLPTRGGYVDSIVGYESIQRRGSIFSRGVTGPIS